MAAAAAVSLIGQTSAAVFVTSAGATAAGVDATSIGVAFSFTGSSISVDNLGAYAGLSDQTGATLGSTITVTLWSNSAQLRTVSITTGDVVGGFIYAPVAPITLNSAQDMR